MSVLTRFRDHCARMAAATEDKPVNVLGEGRCWPTEDERALWARLRDEVDAYLAGQAPTKAPPSMDDPRLDQNSWTGGWG